MLEERQRDRDSLKERQRPERHEHRGEETEGCEEVRFKAKEARERGLLSSPTTMKKGGTDPLKEGAGFLGRPPRVGGPTAGPSGARRWPFRGPWGRAAAVPGPLGP